MKQFLILIFVFFPTFLISQGLYYPPNSSNTWDTLSPASLNYCDEKIDSLYDFLETQNSKAFMLLKDGKIVLEKYFGSFEQDSIWYWASAGKTLTAAIVGIAQQENHLSISDSTSKHLGNGWTSSPKEGLITIRHQLTMTSGLDDGVSNVDCTYDTCLIYLDDPGSRWAYHNAPYTLLDSVIYYSTGQSINQYMISRLKTPTGMKGAYVKLGFNNVYFSDARSMARFGLLLLSKGNWNGNGVITDTTYLNDMLNTSQSLNKSYGYLTWLNGKQEFLIPGSQFIFPGPMNQDAPSDMYAAMGKNGQLLNVVPSQNLIWIRMGNPPSSGGGLISPQLNNDIWKRINDLACSTGMEIETSAEAEFKIFPNPALDKIDLNFHGLLFKDIQLYNASGNLVMHRVIDGKNSLSIDVSDLPGGLYFVRMHGPEHSIVQTLVIH